MRGGALPLVVWTILLSLAAATNAIWTGDLIEMGTFAAALLTVLTVITVLVIRSPEAIRRDTRPAPVARLRAEALPRASFAAAFTAIGLGVFVFGFAFGHFIIYLGAGMVLAGVGRLAGELRAQRRAQRDAEVRK